MTKTGKVFNLLSCFLTTQEHMVPITKSFFPAGKGANLQSKTYADTHLSKARVLTVLSISLNHLSS